MKESAKWQRWKSNKDDAKENNFKVTTVPCLVSLKFDQDVVIFFDCGYELKLES